MEQTLPINRIDVYQDKPQQVEDTSITGKPGMPIDINSAGQAELETLPGIGPSLASRIIEYRIANGPFGSIDAIMDVSGIGPSKFAAIKGLVVAY
jgi:competence protein ComEA